jgi:hypothetical protein
MMLQALGAIAEQSAGGFNPSDISGLIGWWDPSDASTITETTDPGFVEQLDDKSTAGRNLLQSLLADKPATGTRTQNGRNVLDFTTAHLESAIFNQTQPVTIFVVAQSDVIGDAHLIGNGGTTPVIYDGAGSQWRIFAGTVLSSSTTPDTSAHVFSAVFNNTSSLLRLDGTQIASGNANTKGWSNKPFTMGATPDNVWGWNGWIGEVLFYDSVISGTDLTDVETYLNTKWAVY